MSSYPLFVEYTICAVIYTIFCVLVLHAQSLRSKSSKNKNNTILTLLFVFSVIMCITVLSQDIFIFFLGIELLGIMSAIFTAIEKCSKPALSVYAYNIFASLLFLYGILNQNTKLGEWCLLIACFCKSAQFPFSGWLLQATHAHTFVSIFIHCATIIGIAPICLYKFPSLINLYQAITIFGLISAVILPAFALFETNIKKIMAMLTISSAGIMIALCGLKHTDVSMVYFICHAFFKSIIFLIFSYYIDYYKSKDFRVFKNNHGTRIIGCFALLSALGIPPFIGSYAKLLVCSLQMPLFCKISITLSTLLSDVVLIHLYKHCFSRPNAGQKFKLYPVWVLLVVSLLFSVIMFTELNNKVNYYAFIEELCVIFVAYIIANKITVKQINLKIPRIPLYKVFSLTNYINRFIEHIYVAITYRNIYKTGIFLAKLHKNSFTIHVLWIFCGFLCMIIHSIIYNFSRGNLQ